MMKLPLDRRFREWANRSLRQSTFASTIAAEDMGFNNGLCRESEAKIYNEFADEIERDYIPKAVDVNGKPWEINDPCIVYGNDAVVRGYGNSVALIICYCNTGNYSEVHVDYVARPEERTPIEKLRDDMKSYSHSHVPDSVLDGWVKDLDAYIKEQEDK